MSRVLLITPLYPIPSSDNNATDVCHSFAKEWAASGHDVMVVHMQPVHSQIWYLAVRLFGKIIADKVGGGNFYRRRLWKTRHYMMDGVEVYRVPIYNFIPHGLYPVRSVSRFVKKVRTILDSASFLPEIITGHMMPLEITTRLKQAYGCTLAEVFHGVDRKAGRRYSNYRGLFDALDVVGFRSVGIRDDFAETYWDVSNSFICPSGIPSNFLENRILRDFHSFRSFIFAGELIARKNPAAVLQAVSDAFRGREFSLEFVGDGPQLGTLKAMSEELGVSDKVVFRGKISRDEMKAAFDRADCIIMVSRGEAFGLVYLEAMARGCVAIGSRHGGIDGVIVDGVNGFLVDAGDVDGLTRLLNELADSGPERLRTISSNAAETAETYTDRAVAEQYIKNLGA